MYWQCLYVSTSLCTFFTCISDPLCPPTHRLVSSCYNNSSSNSSFCRIRGSSLSLSLSGSSQTHSRWAWSIPYHAVSSGLHPLLLRFFSLLQRTPVPSHCRLSELGSGQNSLEVVFMPLCWRHPWPMALCFLVVHPSVPFSGMPWGIFFRFGLNVHLDWLEFGGE